MQQYLNSKQAHPDCLLFYRMGDFYELFFEDAVKASAILGIALTKRGKYNGEDIAMCGVPVHSSDGYLETLIASGCRVAICEQMEDAEEAKKRGYKAVIHRKVVRIVTPGTITEETLLDARSANYLCAITKTANIYALAWLELSTGEFYLGNPTLASLPAEIAAVQPKEIILSETLAKELSSHEFWQEWDKKASLQPAILFDSSKNERSLKQYYGVAVLDGLGDLSRADIAACGALIEYIALTQIAGNPRLDYPKKQMQNSFMLIDAATRRNLEITATLTGAKLGSLLSAIDKTITGSGARLLTNWLSAPLTSPDAINARLNNVAFFANENDTRTTIRGLLKNFPDIERALSRICLDRASPRDLKSIHAGLEVAAYIKKHFLVNQDLMPPSALQEIIDKIWLHEELSATLASALKEELPILARDGNFVRDSYSDELDHFRMLRDDSKRLILALETRYQQETTINTLKIRYNNVLGYFAEITLQHQKKITEHFIHRQSMANALRYTTTELGELERKISEAGGKAIKLELEIFSELVTRIKSACSTIAQMARAVATLDVASSLGELAVHKNYTRPIVDNSSEFTINAGRHTVVENGLQKSGQGQFIGNDCHLGGNARLWLITGPNMAGKSTFLRQNALIAILAQAGSFVPAEFAHIGVVDKLFSRVGAADDLARGRSTFMVEMVETATILNQATAKSLVILDEIGRGTATFDGLSIAWAVVEHLHNHIKCRSLFATHYHEMTALSAMLPNLSCYTMKVKEWKGNVVFLHEVMKGTADRSYGIHVAKLAGLPESVLKRASTLLTILEENETGKITDKITGDLPLFRVAPTERQPVIIEEKNEITVQANGALQLLHTTNLDELTPKNALELLYRLKEM